MGNIGVQIQGKKIRIARKRLQPHIARESLYPDDYDLSIVLDSKENRKKRSKMERKHMEGVTIEQSMLDESELALAFVLEHLRVSAVNAIEVL